MPILLTIGEGIHDCWLKKNVIKNKCISFMNLEKLIPEQIQYPIVLQKLWRVHKYKEKNTLKLYN